MWKSCTEKEKTGSVPQTEVTTKASPLYQNCPPSVLHSDQRNGDCFLEERFSNCSVNEKMRFQNVFHKTFELLKTKPLKLADSHSMCLVIFFSPLLNIILHFWVVVFKSCHHCCIPSPTDMKLGSFFDRQINCWARLSVFQNLTLPVHDGDRSFWAHQMVVLSNHSKDQFSRRYT